MPSLTIGRTLWFIQRARKCECKCNDWENLAHHCHHNGPNKTCDLWTESDTRICITCQQSRYCQYDHNLWNVWRVK